MKIPDAIAIHATTKYYLISMSKATDTNPKSPTEVSRHFECAISLIAANKIGY